MQLIVLFINFLSLISQNDALCGFFNHHCKSWQQQQQQLANVHSVSGFGPFSNQFLPPIKKKNFIRKNCKWSRTCRKSNIWKRNGPNEIFVSEISPRRVPSQLVILCCRSSSMKLDHCGTNLYRVTRHSYLNAILRIRNALSSDLVIRDISLRKKRGPGPWYMLEVEICKYRNKGIWDELSELSKESNKEKENKEEKEKVSEESKSSEDSSKETEEDSSESKPKDTTEEGTSKPVSSNKLCKILDINSSTSEIVYSKRPEDSFTPESTSATISCIKSPSLLTDNNQEQLTKSGATFFCLKGAWHPFEPKKCITVCPKFSVGNGEITFTHMLGNTVMDGGTATVSCDISGSFVTDQLETKLYSDATTFKCFDGQWSFQPEKCLPMCRKFSLSTTHLVVPPELVFIEKKGQNSQEKYVNDGSYAVLNCNGEQISQIQCKGSTWVQDTCSGSSCFQYFNDKTTAVYWLSNDTYNWFLGIEQCNKLCSEYSSLHSQMESDFAIQLENKQNLNGIWMGLQLTEDANKEISFKWTDKTPVDFLNFQPGNPQRLETENCAYIDGKAGSWDTADCALNKKTLCRINLLL